jgi:hypothetical protein
MIDGGWLSLALVKNVSEAYLAAPPTQEMVRPSRGRGHSRFGVESAPDDLAAGGWRGQAKTGLTATPRRGTAGQFASQIRLHAYRHNPRARRGFFYHDCYDARLVGEQAQAFAKRFGGQISG